MFVTMVGMQGRASTWKGKEPSRAGGEGRGWVYWVLWYWKLSNHVCHWVKSDMWIPTTPFSDCPDSPFQIFPHCWMYCCDGLQCDLICGHSLEAAPVAEEPIAPELPDQSPEIQDTSEEEADAVEEAKEVPEDDVVWSSWCFEIYECKRVKASHLPCGLKLFGGSPWPRSTTTLCSSPWSECKAEPPHEKGKSPAEQAEKDAVGFTEFCDIGN